MLKKNSTDIKLEHLDAWYAATGFNLPRTVEELERFNKLYSDYNFQLTGRELDPFKIWNDENQVRIPDGHQATMHVELIQFKMAARGLKDLPENIRRLMISNQEKSNATSK